jgi:hypothetical protein
LFLKRRENTERERERERKHVKENSKTEERGVSIIFKFSPLLNKNRKEVINEEEEEEEEEDGESPVKIPVRAEKDRRVPRGRGDG